MQFSTAATRVQQSINIDLPCAMEGSAHSLVINALVMSHEEGVGGGWDREIKREEKERRTWRGGASGGGLLALPPGVLSSCQEPDRFPLSGLESVCSMFSLYQCSCLSIYLQHVQSQHAWVPSSQGGGPYNSPHFYCILFDFVFKCNGLNIWEQTQAKIQNTLGYSVKRCSLNHFENHFKFKQYKDNISLIFF